MTDPPPEGCEICGEGPVQIVLHPVAVHFKGSGFYTTDYGRGSRGKSPSKDGDGVSATSSESSGADKTPGTSTSSEKKAAEAT